VRRLQAAGARTSQGVWFVVVEAGLLCGVALLVGAAVAIGVAVLLARAVGSPVGAILTHSLLTTVGLAHRTDNFPSQLSGGEQQRVAIARAVATGAKILLADEPTGNLDQETGAAIIELLFELQQKDGTTLFLVTHDRNLAKRCGRILEVRDGLVKEGRA